MRRVTFTTVSLVFLLGFWVNAFSQSREAKAAPPPTASISGRVMLGEQAASGVTVALTQRRSPNNQNIPLIKAVTDSEGRFQLTNLAAGIYQVAPLAPGFIMPNEGNPYDEGKKITVEEGESVEDVNFSIKRGGVITGRVTDENREPIIETRVNLMRLDARNQAQNTFVRNPFLNTTDDRGIYRIYGLPAGRYKVSVGEHTNSGMVMVGGGNARYQRTFHPDVTDEAKAEIIELSDGGEATNVDVSVHSKMKTYVVTGRIVHSTTGKPVVNVQYGHGAVMVPPPGGVQSMGASAWTGNRTNAKGEFRVEGIAPGRYNIFIVKEEGAELYSEPAIFEVSDANVTGIEVKVRLGATISGLAVIEGATTPALSSMLSQMQIMAQITPRPMESFWNPPKILPDGSFRITGLREGKAQLAAYSSANDKKITLVRVEHNGAEVKDGIEIKDGEQITGVRLVFAHGSATIRGQVKIENGHLPEGARFMIMARRTGGDAKSFQGSSAESDGRGRFVMDGLIAGEYELMLMPRFAVPPTNRALLKPIKQTVTVAEGADMQVNFVVDLGEKEKQQ